MRKAFIAALMCAGALAACDRQAEETAVAEATPADSAELAAAPGETAPAAEDAGAPAAEVAAPTDRPVRKAGLWEITSTGEGGGTSTLCVSNATEASPRGHAFATLGGGGFGGRGGPGGPGPSGPRPGGGEGGPGGGGGGGGGGEGRGPGGGFGGGGFGGGNPACQPKIAKAGDGWTSTSSCTIDRGGESVTMSSKLTLTGDLATSYTVKGSRTTPRGTTPVSVTATYKGPCPAGVQPGDLTTASGMTRNVLQGRGGGRQG